MTVLQSEPAVTDSGTSAGTFSFIVPAYNEAAVLEETVTRIADRLQGEPGSEVLIVENGSTDRTWSVAQELARRDWGEVRVRALQSEQGLAQAYRAGASVATGRHVVFTAADLPFGFTDVDAFLAVEPRPAFAIGSKGHPRSHIERSIQRRLMSLGFRVLRWAVIGPSPKDPQGSLVVDLSLCRDLVPGTTGGGFIFGTELSALARLHGVTPVEVPVVLADERRSSTVRPLHDSWKMVRALLSLRRRLDRDADELARSRAAHNTGPGPVLARVVSTLPPAARAGVVFAAGVWGLVLALAGILFVGWSVRELALAPTGGAPGVRRLVAVALLAVLASLGVAIGASRLLRRALTGRRGERGPGVPEAPPRAAPGRSAGATTRPARSRERLALALSAVCAMAASMVLGLWRVLPDLGERGLGSGDARYWYWLGWRLAEQIRHGDLVPGGIGTVIWPMGYSVRAADGFLPTVVLTAWNLLVPDPTLAFNLATATAIATTTLAGVRLARTLGAGPGIAGVAGLALGIAPSLSVRLEGHTNLLFAFPAVLLVDVGLRHVLRRTQPLPVLRTAAVLALAYLSSGYYLVYGGVALAAIVVAGMTAPRRFLDTAVRLGAAVVLAVVVLSPFLVPKMRMERREEELGATALSVDNETFASDATSVFVPPDGTWLSVDDVERYNDKFGAGIIEGTAFPGALPLLGLGVLLLFRSPVRRALLAAGGAMWVLSLGTTLAVEGDRLPPGVRWMPATLLLELPGFTGVRAPNRASFVLAAIAVGAAVVVLGWLLRVSGRATASVVVVASLVLVAASVRLPGNSAAEVSGPLGVALRAAAAEPDPGAVLHLPDDCQLTIPQVEYQIVHQLPEVGCQGFTAAIPWRAELGPYAAAASWAALRCEPQRVALLPTRFPADEPPTPEAVRALRRELGVGVVVFEATNLCPARSPAILAALRAAARPLGGDDDTFVFALPPDDGTAP